MTKPAMFIPLVKADAAQRLVYGYIDETPDRAAEVMDYATAKPAFQAWSDDMAKASGGKSLGNIRAQHDLTKAAGRLTQLTFDDDLMRIEFCAHIVDDQDWAKVEAGVYTGFSPGGRYAKRWKDGANHRYTPMVGELSIVDVPCIPTGTFTMTKADGATEEISFVLDKAYEPGNDATKDRAEEMAKAAGTGTYKDHVIQARAELILENANDALAKMAEAEAEPAADPAPEVTEPDRVSAMDAALAKADIALVGAPETISRMAVYAGAMSGKLLKSDIDLAIAPPSPEAVALIGADFTKSLAAVELIHELVEPMLAKGLYSLGEAVCSLQSFSWIAQDAIFEASYEADGSSLPQQAVDIVLALKAFVIAMVEEEVSEMLARAQQDAGPEVSIVITAGEEMALANQIIDLVKADTDRMAKAGARNAAKDAVRIQTIHDKACELGAGCAEAEGLVKTETLAAENERLAKAIDDALPRIEQLIEGRAADQAEMAALRKEVARLGDKPAPSKVVLAITKEQDGILAKTDEPELGSIDAVNALPVEDRPQALEAMARQSLNKRNTKTPA